MKTDLNAKNFITKMISAENCTNSENFNGFRRGCRINLVKSHGFTLKYITLISTDKH